MIPFLWSSHTMFRFHSTHRKKLLLIIGSFSISALFPLTVQASGACCTVSLGERNRPAVTIVASTGWSHEIIGGTTFDLRQYALIAKGSLPLGDNFFASGHVGIPFKTDLTAKSGNYSGTMGYLYGVGVGGILPQVIPSFNIVGSLNYTRSVGTLNKNGSATLTDASFVISEVQGIVLGEYEITSEAAIYGGARFYSGKNKIDNKGSNTILSANREGSISPFFGIRHSLSDGLSLVGEGSFGHIRIVSLALNINI